MAIVDTVNTDRYPFLAGGGETGALIRNYPWEKTSIGPADGWPQSLKTCLRIILTSSQPMFVWWGPELINFYNDAYRAIVGGKHPASLGQPAHKVWTEIWGHIVPRVEQCLHNNEGTYDEAMLLIMERNGYPEETYYTFSYSPIPGDDGVPAGILCANTDDTDRILSARQMRTLKDLARYNLNSKRVQDVYTNSLLALQENEHDFPFAFFYAIDHAVPHLKGYTVHDLPENVFPREANADDSTLIWPLAEVLRRNSPLLTEQLQLKAGPLPSGSWKLSPDKALVLPVQHNNSGAHYGVLIIGLNPHRKPDEKYLAFFQLVADQIGGAIASTKAYEEEQRRVNSLMEIDRAKTIFFSNISHEFRTPLSLMLGPLEDMLARAGELPEGMKEELQLAQRNTRRLLKLVNSLLDFSSIEAGRMQASYAPVDIAALTRDLVSNFEPAIKKAGVTLVADYEHLSQPVYVDRDMWEKIVLNLVSNAFKYTLEGRITISLREYAENVELTVEDTGVGIPEAELPQMFQRFHRVQNKNGRSQEGTGIGLSLVNELVKLHGGTIQVNSREGEGTVFTVSLPLGHVHLPADKVIHTAGHAGTDSRYAFMEEASRWDDPAHPKTTGPDEGRPYVLLADDNADMREYIRRLLGDHFEVIAVRDGAAALEAIARRPPDLVISDVMMPLIDGFALVKLLKQNPLTMHLPVLLLSARAGEDATVEGLGAGADDYLAKPFSSRELMSRVDANINTAKARNHAASQLRDLFRQAPVAILLLHGPDHVVELANSRYLETVNMEEEELIGKSLLDIAPVLHTNGYRELLDKVLQTGEPYEAQAQELTFIRQRNPVKQYFNYVLHPVRSYSGSITGIMMVAVDVTETINALQRVESSEKYYRHLLQGLPAAIYTCDAEGRILWYNEAAVALWGRTPVVGQDLWCGSWKIFDVDGKTPVPLETCPMAQALKTGEAVRDAEIVVERPDGSRRHVQPYPDPILDDQGRVTGAVNMLIDITELRAAQIHMARLAAIVQGSDDAIISKTLDGTITTWNPGAEKLFGYTSEEAIGQSIMMLIPEERASEETEIIDRLRKGIVVDHFETKRRTKDGRLLDISLTVSPLRDARGYIVGASKIARDITEQKKLFSALQESEARYMKVAQEMEEIVAQRTLELTEANYYLEKSNKELEQFAFVTSHDLQEPLRKIHTFAGLLCDSRQDTLSDTGKLYIEKMMISARRMSQLIHDLLNFSRLNRTDDPFVPTDLNEVMVHVLNDFEVTVGQKKASVTIDPLPTIPAIPLQMNQLLYNLLGNALKFTSEDRDPEIRVSARLLTPEDFVTYTELDVNRSYYEIAVKDNGIGFNQIYENKIFQIFQRLNNRTAYEGTGIGLALCNKIAINHKGCIRALGVPGEGAVFNVVLPAM
ncbi:PAS domain S-box protein [Chitinophaga oryzae]|uniref:histidine kinase n=1 Tax=Chitinophaga oryzae TaxID=2725414 RepID=A0AAE6ZCD2_9BACT|nr:PAS domain S-box protein [Chitinophaga oryzae]QJB30378.1 PAS domain S-box protein [Chitinophaga oryzae]QJB36887.1 PAS domain S-box protein [Chitinophaga oryzae]